MYTTIESYISEFGEDDIPSGDNDRVTRAIARASRLADTYARAGGIDTPIVDTVALLDIEGPILDIARYYTWSDSPSEEIRKRYEDALSFFSRVASGKVKILTDEGKVAGAGFANIRLVRA